MMDESPENVDACDSLASLASKLEPDANLDAERLRIPVGTHATQRRASGDAAAPRLFPETRNVPSFVL